MWGQAQLIAFNLVRDYEMSDDGQEAAKAVRHRKSRR